DTRSGRSGAGSGDRWPDPLQGTRHRPPQPRSTPRARQRDPGRVPGSVHLAQPVLDDRTHPRRAVDGTGRRVEGGIATGARAAGPGTPAVRRRRPAATRVLRRAAATHRHRARPRARAGAHRLRRTGVRARPVDPGPRHGSVHGDPEPHRGGVPVRVARPDGCPPPEPPRRRHVPRRDRGMGRGRPGHLPATASVHPAAAVRRPGSRPGPATGAARATPATAGRTGRRGCRRMTYPNPLIPGFHPDPSVVKVEADYYLATSTFEYLPGIPVFHSTDLVSWELIGHVVERPGQLASDVPTNGGAWAPTIRHRDGTFFVVVTDAMGRGMLVFTADSPRGPWSDGIVVDGVHGIDPDLAWDDDGTAYITYSGLDTTSGERFGGHGGIRQVTVDLDTGKPLSASRQLWSGTGLKFPEAPHLYRHD